MNAPIARDAASPLAARAGNPAGRRHVQSLDGLRAIAVLGVILYHCHVPGMNLGFLGVDVFFVLSGFLITTLLLEEHAAFGRIDFPKFMARRFLRLMPAYWLYAVGITLAITLGTWEWLGAWWTPSRLIASIWLYFANFAPVAGVWEGDTLTNHLWSLCIEEQFYLVWPPLLALALRARIAGALALVLCIASLAALLALDDRWATTMLFTRGFSLCVGCACGLWLASRRAPTPAWLTHSRSCWSLALLCVLAFAIPTAIDARLGLTPAGQVRAAVPWLAPIAALLCASLWLAPAGGVPRALAWRPLAYVGKISYGVYLYHMLPRFFVFEVMPQRWFGLGYNASLALRTLAVIASTLVIASVSSVALERPIQRLSARFRPLARDAG